jgi:hypothetical protein
MNYLKAGNSCSVKDLDCNPAKSRTQINRSEFRIGDVLLETAIAVTCVRVGHAHNEHEHDDAFAELEDLRSQRGQV